jgi:hypothetical protein
LCDEQIVVSLVNAAALLLAPSELSMSLVSAGLQHEKGTQTLIAPWTVVNIGLSEGWDAVFEGWGETPLVPSGPSLT